MKLAIAIFLLLSVISSPTSAKSQCSVGEMDRGYEDCRSLHADDPSAVLRCVKAMVGFCEAAEMEQVESLSPPSSRNLASLDQTQSGMEMDEPLRQRLLRSDDPNYFVFATPDSGELGDVNHVEFYLSIKYPLYDQTKELSERDRHLDALTSSGDWSHFFKPDRWLFHYNGLYDFYTLDEGENGQYDSSPITSRRQNPGVSLEYDWGGRSSYWTTRYGYFHESNGQQLDEEDSARFEFLRLRDSEEYALSQVSRGWDYMQLRFDHSNFSRNGADGALPSFERQGTGLWHWSAEFRWYRPDQVFGLGGSREDDIWWEPERNAAIEEFDGLRLMGEYSPVWLNWGEIGLTPRLELKSSLQEPFQRVSYKASTELYLDKVNLTLFYFDGYGKDPSTYHLRSRYWGLGLELR